MGLFIAIEGGDGSGKGTHSELLLQHCIAQGFAATKVSFPRYGTDSAFYVEKYLNGAYGQADDVPADLGVLPYAIDRFAASGDIRLQLANEKAIVIADRYMASNLAHQGTKIQDSQERATFYERTKITEYGVLGIPKPDKTIVLVMPTAHMQSNVDKKSTRDYTSLKRDIHEADANHLEKAKSNFEELCTMYPKEFKAIYCTDDQGDMRPIAEIQDEIRELIFAQAE